VASGAAGRGEAGLAIRENSSEWQKRQRTDALPELVGL